MDATCVFLPCLCRRCCAMCHVLCVMCRAITGLLLMPLASRTEKGVQEALNGLKTNRTTVVIAHRLSTIRNADQILVLREGQVSPCPRGSSKWWRSQGGAGGGFVLEGLNLGSCSLGPTNGKQSVIIQVRIMTSPYFGPIKLSPPIDNTSVLVVCSLCVILVPKNHVETRFRKRARQTPLRMISTVALLS